MEEGYVPGGGTIQLRASEMLMHQLAGLNEKPADFRAGWCVVAEALRYPFRQLCENASANAVRIQVDMELQPWMHGYDPIKEEVCDMYDAGIIDPTKVARLTLENATSVAIQFLNTSCAMAASNDEKGS